MQRSERSQDDVALGHYTAHAFDATVDSSDAAGFPGYRIGQRLHEFIYAGKGLRA